MHKLPHKKGESADPSPWLYHPAPFDLLILCKLKCSSEKPSCKNCVSGKLTCQYVFHTKSRSRASTATQPRRPSQPRPSSRKNSDTATSTYAASFPEHADDQWNNSRNEESGEYQWDSSIVPSDFCLSDKSSTVDGSEDPWAQWPLSAPNGTPTYSLETALSSHGPHSYSGNGVDTISAAVTPMSDTANDSSG